MAEIAQIPVYEIYESKYRHCVYVYTFEGGGKIEYFKSPYDAKTRYKQCIKPGVIDGFQVVALFIDKKLKEEIIKPTVMIDFALNRKYRIKL